MEENNDFEEQVKEALEKEEKVPKKKDNDNKKLILIIAVSGLIVFILLILIISMIIKGNKPKDTPKDKPTTNGTTEKEEIDPDLVEDTRERIPRTAAMLYLYVVDGELIEDAYCDDACKAKQSGYVNFEVAELDARVLDIAPTSKYEGKFPDYVLYRDGSKIKYFKIAEFRSYTVGVSSEYIKYKAIEYNGNLEAIYFKKKGENGIYSLLANKNMYVNKYEKYEILAKGLITGINGDKKEVLSLSEEKVLENVDVDLLSKLTKKANFNILEESSGDSKFYTIYDNNYNVIANKIDSRLTYFEGSKVYFIKDEAIYGYENSGNKFYENKMIHDDLLMVMKDYYVALNNNFAELRELNGDKIVAKEEIFGYKINYYQSGIKEKSELTTLTGHGIYLSFNKESNGKLDIIELYYNPNTGESKTETTTK